MLHWKAYSTKKFLLLIKFTLTAQCSFYFYSNAAFSILYALKTWMGHNMHKYILWGLIYLNIMESEVIYKSEKSVFLDNH